ncbi:MAG: hypothetical protein ACE5GB_00405 [Acidimicrobiales bacterium]
MPNEPSEPNEPDEAATADAVVDGAPSQAPGTGQVLKMDLYLIGTDVEANVTNPPEPGQQNFIGGDLYELDEAADSPSPTGDPVGRAVGLCTQVTQEERTCSGVFNLHGRGLLTVQVEVVRGSNQGVAVTGGTGEFAGARGTILETAVSGRPTDRLNQIEVTTLAAQAPD